MKLFTNKIIIEIPTAIASYWSTQTAIAPLFNSNNLSIRIPKEKYSPVTKQGRIKQVKGISSTVVTKSNTFIGFRVKIDDSREALRMLLKELAEYSVGNDECEANPINILDYHYRRDRADLERGYRLRRGIFTSFEEQQGTLTEGNLYCDGTEVMNGGYRTAGVSFQFMEIEPVGYF